MDQLITEDAKIAKLWSLFHHLSKDEQKLVITLSQQIRETAEIPGSPEAHPGRGASPGS
ncbi:MAG: hypothetical protein LBD08_03520 [Treponema sp.]|nr:hypothetical protein [Treponema sp.]